MLLRAKLALSPSFFLEIRINRVGLCCVESYLVLLQTNPILVISLKNDMPLFWYFYGNVL